MGFLSYVYYAYFIMGSVTVGYLLFRLTYPEIRLLPSEQKLGIAAIAGIFLTLAALLIDYLYDGMLEVLSGNGVYAMILFMLFLLSFVFLRLYFVFSKPEYLTVGVPTFPAINIQIVKSEEAEMPREKEVNEIIGVRKGSDVKDKSGSHKRDLIEKLRKGEMQVVAEERVELRKKEGFLSGIMDIFRPKEDKRIPIEELKRATVMPVMPQQMARPENLKPRLVLAAEKAEAEKLKGGRAAAQARPDERKDLQAEFRAQIPQSEILPEQAKAPRKEGFMSMIGGLIAGRKETAQPERKAQVSGRPEEGRQAKDVGGSEAGKSPESAATPGLSGPTSQQGQKKESLMGMKAEIMRDEPLHIPEKRIRKEDELLHLKSDERALQEQRKHAEELQAELILQDILPKEVKQQASLSAAPGRRLYQNVQQQKGESVATQQVAVPGTDVKQEVIVHRRYLLSADKQEQPKGVSVIAHENTAKQENFDLLVSDVYSQLKTGQKEGLRSSLAISPPKDAISKTAEEKAMTFEDLIGEKPKNAAATGGEPEVGKGEPKPAGIFSQLSDIAQQAPAESVKAKPDIAFVKIEAEKGMGCPTCHSKNTKIIFCPYCGTGMCANCSPSIKIKEGAFIYTCPKCKEEVDVRKKMPQAAAMSAVA